MARRCFFSFQYVRDVWRAQQVKNGWLTHRDREAAGFFDSSAFETAKKSDDALKTFLNSELHGSSVTCVLIGAETYTRRWVRYELVRSFARGKGLLGARIHALGNREGRADISGSDPLAYLSYELDEANNLVRFKEWKDGSWVGFGDLPTMKYSDLPYVLPQTNAQFSSLFHTYDYVSDDGYNNIGRWIEKAATDVGR